MPFNLQSLVNALFALVSNILCAVLTTVMVLTMWHGEWHKAAVVAIPASVLWYGAYKTTKLPLLFKYVRGKIDQAKKALKTEKTASGAEADKLQDLW